jgi:hypothetical protein
MIALFVMIRAMYNANPDPPPLNEHERKKREKKRIIKKRARQAAEQHRAWMSSIYDTQPEDEPIESYFTILKRRYPDENFSGR